MRQQRSSSVAKRAAKNAMKRKNSIHYVPRPPPLNKEREDAHLERVIQSVNNAAKRLSEADSLSTSVVRERKRNPRDTIGPWKLGKTLGKGSSGRVRLAKNTETGKLAAVKIVPKNSKKRSSHINSINSYTKLYSSSGSQDITTNSDHNTVNNSLNPYGIEREIVIMKLINHPNIMGLLEVWENKSELYLVLEYVDGGELFDYLVARGRLPESEAIHYFKQIIQGVSYCHTFNISHRDLKPENLLLDKKNKSIKIADFGMAALELPNKLLETSCGSPHYASPEIVMGKPYHGGPSDIWSCGIILFALLTGHLPFNDDNIKKLLLKVQSGRYNMPQNLSPEAKDLISRILVVDPRKRITIEGILSHRLINKYTPMTAKQIKDKLKHNKGSKSNSNLQMSHREPPNIVALHSRSEIDESILRNLQILWHGASREILIAKLLQTPVSDEKLFYSLLWEYKQRHSIPLAFSKDEISLPASSKSGWNEYENTQSLNMTTNEIRDLEKVESVSYGSQSQLADNSIEEKDINAPVLEQKSQFSMPSIKSRITPPEPTSIPPLPPAVPIFTASSSRLFNKSSSVKSLRSSVLPNTRSSSKKDVSNLVSNQLQMSPSSISLHSIISHKPFPHNPEKVPLPAIKKRRSPSKKRTLQNSESKRSLYSSQSISKRSLNLNDALNSNSNKTQNQYHLPRTDSNREFEILCEQILFGNALDKILEADEDEIEDQSDIKNTFADKKNEGSLGSLYFNAELSDQIPESREKAKQYTIMPAFSLNTRVTDGNSEISENNNTKRSNESITTSISSKDDDISRSKHVPDQDKQKFLQNFKRPTQRASSLHHSPSMKALSLDPRRNITAPAKANVITSLLHSGSRQSADTQGYTRRVPPDHQMTDLNQQKYQEQSIDEKNNDLINNFISVENFDEQSVLAQSSTLRNIPIKNSSTPMKVNLSYKNPPVGHPEDSLYQTFIGSTRDLKTQKLHDKNIRNVDSKRTLAPPQDLNTGLDRNISQYSFDTRDHERGSIFTRLTEVPTTISTAQAIPIMNEEGDRVLRYINFSNNDDNSNDDIRKVSAATAGEDRSNLFEDPATDHTSLNTSSTDSVNDTTMKKKVLSIDTLNAADVGAPTTNVRVSLIVNNNNMPYNSELPRETTEQLISRFKLSPEKASYQHLQKRFSLINKPRNSLGVSQSVLSMFRDLEEDNNDNEPSQADILVNTIKDFDKMESEALKNNRVTLLFESDSATRTQNVECDSQPGEENASEIDKDNNNINIKHNVIANEAIPENSKLEIRHFEKHEAHEISTGNSAMNVSKLGWFSKLFSGFPGRNRRQLVHDHYTTMSFEETYRFLITQFHENNIDYTLKHLDRKGKFEKVEYNCKFNNGNFRFKIKILSDSTEQGVNSTIITIKKKSTTSSAKSNENFSKFNEHIAKTIQQCEY